MLDRRSNLKGLSAMFVAGVVTAGATGQTPEKVLPAAATPTPLLREGTFMLQVNGSLQRGEQPGVWVFRIASDDPSKEMFELTLLPCTLLASLEQLVESMPDEQIVFDLTGQVFVYRGRNYLMPTHAPRLVDYVAPSRPDDLDDPAAVPADSAEAILRELDRTVGPLVHSPRRAAADANVQPIAPGTMMLWRHGWMVREPAGAWSFVFGADATGLSDPPMILLPCRMLEDMERHALRSGPDKPLLVSGRVSRYRGRNYVLPTMFRIPRYTSALRP
jgi:hypothetical protein